MIKDFCKPTTIMEALNIKEKFPDYRFIAGGTEINARGYIKRPANASGLISLSKLGMNEILREENRLIIYPTVTLQQLIDSPELDRPPFDILKKAASNVSNRNIRNMATIGGNIAACKSCSDMIPVLLVMDASLEVYMNTEINQTISVIEYIQKKDRPLITKITLPEKKDFYIAICRYTRTSNDLALINVCLGLELKDGICKDAKLAIGGVGATPLRITETEKFLQGREINGKLQDFAPELRKNVEEIVQPIDDLRGKAWFKRELAGGLAIEALYEAARKGGITL